MYRAQSRQGIAYRVVASRQMRGSLQCPWTQLQTVELVWTFAGVHTPLMTVEYPPMI